MSTETEDKIYPHIHNAIAEVAVKIDDRAGRYAKERAAAQLQRIAVKVSLGSAAEGEAQYPSDEDLERLREPLTATVLPHAVIDAEVERMRDWLEGRADYWASALTRGLPEDAEAPEAPQLWD